MIDLRKHRHRTCFLAIPPQNTICAGVPDDENWRHRPKESALIRLMSFRGINSLFVA
jgi:hypothetical protein